MTIPYDIHDIDFFSNQEKSYIPASTTKKDYEEEIRVIKRALGDNRGKTVAARTIRIDIRIDLDSTFDNLCSSYPEAFVFMFSTPETGTWIGASPELLLSKEGDFLSTMALAGTRPFSGTDNEWDDKNREEQAMVTEFIIETLMKRCGTVTAGKTFTKRAGQLEHICTPIRAYMPQSDLAEKYEDSFSNRLRRLLTELSPTPALCGSDRALSLDLIGKSENFSREMYGGFCGPNDINGTSVFFVNLRSAKVSHDAICVFAGGGITALSDSEEEWNETEMKSKTIINKLKTSEE